MTVRGRSFLLTGATGFLGKVVLSELLRRKDELDLERVYVLIRPRGDLGAADRFRREVVGSACFSKTCLGMIHAAFHRTVKVACG